MKAVNIAHMLMKECIKEGDSVIDATSGNGHDTLFLSTCVGINGEVIAIDIQEDALRSTQRLMQQHERLNVKYMHMNHADIGSKLQECLGKISCISFNLGYLPGAEDHSIITSSQSTIQALEASCSLLNDEGCIGVIAYRGHPHGLEESHAVEQWMQALSPREWHVIAIEAVNQSNTSPIVFFARKKHQSSIT